jgi:4-hydroxy-tetrahydrodipicolinate synthase
MPGNTQLRGVFSPVVTPFNADLSPSPERFAKHCAWLTEQGVGLSVFGTNSEANSLSLNEKRSLLDGLLAHGIDRSMLMPGTGVCAMPETIELTKHAVEAGCAGVLMLPPFYYKGVSDEGLYRAFSHIIDSVGDSRLKVFLYHIPPVAQIPLTLNLIERLIKKYPGTVAGIKDSSGDWSNTKALLDNFQSDNFSVFAGSEVFLLRTLRGGGAGCITATGNVNPAAIQHLFKTWEKSAADADAQQAKLDATRAIFQKFPVISAMKQTLAEQSGDKSWAIVRPPLVELEAQQNIELAALLKGNGFHIPNAAKLAL